MFDPTLISSFTPLKQNNFFETGVTPSEDSATVLLGTLVGQQLYNKEQSPLQPLTHIRLLLNTLHRHQARK